MKKKNLLSCIRLSLSTALRYWYAHSASLKAIKKDYGIAWQDELTRDKNSIKLKICPYGSIYRVTRLYYINDVFTREESWLATYGWHSNGHLIAIGCTRYLIFDPLQKSLYLEDWPDSGERTVEIYHQI